MTFRIFFHGLYQQTQPSITAIICIGQQETMQKQPKIKLKTLPNELNVQREHHVFQSQSDEHFIKTIDLSSPTFATNDLKSQDGDAERTHRMDETNKQNRVSLSLKEFKNKGNVPELRNVNDLQSCFQSNKKSDITFLKAQNQYLVQKCKELDGVSKQYEQQNKVLNQKLAVLKKSLEDKYFAKVAKFLQMPNSSKDQSNVDIYLEMQAYKQDYKKCRENYLPLENENMELKQKIQELEGIITNYTEKSDKKRIEKLENSERIKDIQKYYQDKLDEAKKMQKKYENEGKQKQKQIKKLKEEYEKIEKKRQEDIRMREQLETSLKEKQNVCYSLKQQLLKSQDECQHLTNKLSAFNKSSQNFEQELMKSNEELSKLQLSVVSLQTQNSRYKHNLENYKLVNQKYSSELTQLRRENQSFYDQVQSLKIQKDRLQSIISKQASNDDRQLKRIAELENKYNQTQKQLEEVKAQFEQCVIKNTARNYPEVSKFKEQEEISEKLSTERAQDSLKSSAVQQKIKDIEEKYNKIIEQLNKQIQQLRKCKQNLQLDLDSERQRNEKLNIQLQNTFRKFEEYGYTDFDGGRDIKQKDRFKRGDFYGTNIGLPFELTRTTKATPQLRMIREILSAILGSRDAQKLSNKMLGGFKEKDMGSAEFLIQDIKRLAEEMADLFDDRSKQIQMLINRIQTKEEVISKLLRFTPEQKKIPILDYLKVMESIDEYAVEYVYKVKKSIEEEASQWKRYINSLVETVEKNQQQVLQLRRQIGKYRSQGTGLRKYELNYGDAMGKRQRVQKLDKVDRERDRDRQQKYQKYQYRRY